MDRDVVIIELKISGERTKQGYLMRKSVAEETEALTDDMLRAKHEICRAYRIIAGRMYAGQNDLLRVPGQSGADGEWEQAQIDRLDAWAKALPKLKDGRNVYNVCLDICAFGMTYRECADSRFLAPSTVMRKLRIGLNEFCLLAGRGNQIRD